MFAEIETVQNEHRFVIGNHVHFGKDIEQFF